MENTNKKASAEQGAEFLGSLLHTLQEDFTPDQAAAITTAVMLAIVFHDDIVAYWNDHGEDVMKNAVKLAELRAGGDAHSD